LRPPPPPPPPLLLFAAAVVMWTVWLMRMTVQLGVILGVWNRMVVLFHGVHVERQWAARGLWCCLWEKREHIFCSVLKIWVCDMCTVYRFVFVSHARERIFKDMEAALQVEVEQKKQRGTVV
jgi:hypothetical protein